MTIWIQPLPPTLLIEEKKLENLCSLWQKFHPEQYQLLKFLAYRIRRTITHLLRPIGHKIPNIMPQRYGKLCKGETCSGTFRCTRPR